MTFFNETFVKFEAFLSLLEEWKLVIKSNFVEFEKDLAARQLFSRGCSLGHHGLRSSHNFHIQPDLRTPEKGPVIKDW